MGTKLGLCDEQRFIEEHAAGGDLHNQAYV